MSFPRVFDLPGFNGVGAGQTATLRIPTVGTYLKLFLYYTESGVAVTKADMETAITEIRLKVNGRVQRALSAAQLFVLHQRWGKSVTSGEIPIYFAEPWRRTPVGEDAYAWGMSDVDVFELEVDIAAGRTAPALSAWCWRREVDQPMGIIRKTRRYTANMSLTGENFLDTLPKQDPYTVLYFNSTAITKVRVLLDQREALSATPGVLDDMADDYGLASVAGWTILNFDVTRRFAEMLAMREELLLPNNTVGARTYSDFRVGLTMSTGASFPLVAEVVGPRD